MLDVRREVAGIMDNVTAGLHRPQPFLFIIKHAYRSHSFYRETACVKLILCLRRPPTPPQREATRSRALREKDQTAHGTWPSKYSVQGVVAQKRRAGVLATASRPRLAKEGCFATRAARKPHLRATKVVCNPLLDSAAGSGRDIPAFFSVSHPIWLELRRLPQILLVLVRRTIN